MVKRYGALAASALFAGLALLGLVLFPEAASRSAREGVTLCISTIVPSLFPFMVLGSLITELGLTGRAAGLLSPLTARLFGVSGTGCGAFLLGLTGGYPLGAVTAAQLYKNGSVSKAEAERLLGFCDNTGPAFIVGVAGGAVFHSSKVGLFLYGAHVLSAILTGMLLCWRSESRFAPPSASPRKSFPAALSASVKRSVSLCAGVCGFVVFFSVLLGLMSSSGLLAAAEALLTQKCGMDALLTHALFAGFFELGNGMGALGGATLCRGSLCLCSAMLAFGGLSVHAQAYSEISEGGLSSAKHLFGKLLHGALSALVTLIAYPVFF